MFLAISAIQLSLIKNTINRKGKFLKGKELQDEFREIMSCTIHALLQAVSVFLDSKCKVTLPLCIMSINLQRNEEIMMAANYIKPKLMIYLSMKFNSI